jgi:hypothetical protein
MNSLVSKPRPPTVPILARVTEAEREALKEVIWEEGYMSVSSWIRQQIVQKLRAAQAGQEAPDQCRVKTNASLGAKSR